MDKIEEDSIEFLHKYYEKAMKYVADSKYYTNFVEEKYCHSMQVVGAMKYIMKHEPTFQNRDQNFINCTKIATILHDIGRFEEVCYLYDQSKENNVRDIFIESSFDHGAIGYEILKKSNKYNNQRISVSVKHHGHMTDVIYDDDEYIKIKDKNTKKELLEILNLVRDADKTANYYLFTTSGEKRFPTMFPRSKGYEGRVYEISPLVRNDFSSFKLLKTSTVKNYLERQMQLLAWVFDLNYLPAFDLIIKNGSLMKVVKEALIYCKKDEDKLFIINIINDFFKGIPELNFELPKISE